MFPFVKINFSRVNRSLQLSKENNYVMLQYLTVYKCILEKCSYVRKTNITTIHVPIRHFCCAHNRNHYTEYTLIYVQPL